MLDGYDYADFGGLSVGAKPFVDKSFKAEKGLILSPDQKVIAAAKKAGLACETMQPTDRDRLDGKVRFSIVSGCLERLSASTDVATVLANAVHISRSFVYIQTPWFDSDGYLLTQGVKLHWSDWTVHSTPLTSLQLLQALQPMLNKQAIARVAIWGKNRIEGSADPRLLPLGAPRNSGKYDPAKHGQKPSNPFSAPVYNQLVALVARKDAKIVDTLTSKIKDADKLYDSAGTVTPAHSSSASAGLRTRASLGERPSAPPPLRRFR